ncbi:beta-galactosidase [Aliifodinibius sp. S!AR15-10]|uniref:beta-galactosidase n=1 Tax=Aliifodinibius sp. S!AR15-10 TaxID=2950437 RepID=UPI00286257D1|nr:beta-galactosidase [Aliifodinibius sp. S!AR15-10]MDR8394535.1 beta-galactosidase [Aliifodinibius sp. S!AR15-10]
MNLIMEKLGYLVFVTFLLTFNLVYAQNNYQVDVRDAEQKIIRGHLNLGGSNPQGDSISVNNYFLEYNEDPFYPIVGEFHYSRYPEKYWEDSILKMKAGGINVIATYVFWNMHEREEGEFDWEGQLNLRRFIELVEKHNMKAIVRLGPFCHGEVRNGGIPDWLYGRPFDIRSNDSEYLGYVERLYGQIAQQIEGMLFKDGGPIIGVQLENEFQHSAAKWWLHYPGSPIEYTASQEDTDVIHEGVSISEVENDNAQYGSDHMENLKTIAQNAGIDVPIYTATGWGNAAIVKKGSIPVTAAYAYPTWAPRGPSPFYLYKDMHKNPDYAPVSYDSELYPSVPAELGTGIMITYSRRPTVNPNSIEPMMVRTIGSGSNGIGYYMYHGGSTPVFDGHFYNEEVGGYTKISYDFQAPIGEFGKLRYHYHSLKLLHFFLESYGQELAPMETVLPETNKQITPDDVNTLRYAVRSDGNSGFVFMHNFQDDLATNDLENLRLNIQTETGEIILPSTGTFSLLKDESAILPFNLNLDGAEIRYATVQPLTILNREDQKHFIFFSNDGINPEFVFENVDQSAVDADNAAVEADGGLTKVSGESGEIFSFTVNEKRFLVVPKPMALKAWKIDEGQMIFTDATILPKKGYIDILSNSGNSRELRFYPKLDEMPRFSGAQFKIGPSASDHFSTYEVSFPKVEPPFRVDTVSAERITIRSTGSFEGLNDVIMKVDYTGDRAMAFIDGKLVGDHFYYGKPWEIGMRKFEVKMQNDNLLLRFHPMRDNAEYLQDFDESDIPSFSNRGSYLQVDNIEFIPEYKAKMVIP